MTRPTWSLRVVSSFSALVLAWAVAQGCKADGPQAAASASLQASTRPGMGAVPYSGGVSFRVWAPYATRVWVAGDFNGFSATANELGNEFNGNFSGDVPGA